MQIANAKDGYPLAATIPGAASTRTAPIPAARALRSYYERFTQYLERRLSFFDDADRGTSQARSAHEHSPWSEGFDAPALDTYLYRRDLRPLC